MLAIVLVLSVIIITQSREEEVVEQAERLVGIPPDAVKQTPATDLVRDTSTQRSCLGLWFEHRSVQ
ncbi:MAG: hypothetical protein ACUVT7_08385 [Thermoplasmata archaeon]